MDEESFPQNEDRTGRGLVVWVNSSAIRKVTNSAISALMSAICPWTSR